MASFRRTLSPARHDRHHHNGGGGASFSPHKFSPYGGNAKHSSAPAPYSRLLLSALFNFGRKGWWRSLFRLFLFFVAGFLFGMFPFGNMDAGGPKKDFAFTDFERPTVNQTFTSVSLGIDLKKMEVRDEEDWRDWEPRKQLIVVTPTYNRFFQAYFLNRLGQVLRLVKPPLLWIVVEEKTASFETAEILRKSGVVYRHLVSCRNWSDVKDRGVHQRNAALEHIELHRLDGIVYFADDDNIYSIDLFESLRSISRFGTWPVAMLAQSKNKAILEGPVCNGSQVIGWHTNEKSMRLRRFHVDMSGFAFNSTILWDPKRWHRPFSNPIRQLDTLKEGFQETTFIEQVVEDESQMEGTPSGCSRILNWHLHLDTQNLAYPKGWEIQRNLNTVLPIQ